MRPLSECYIIRRQGNENKIFAQEIHENPFQWQRSCLFEEAAVKDAQIGLVFIKHDSSSQFTSEWSSNLLECCDSAWLLRLGTCGWVELFENCCKSPAVGEQASNGLQYIDEWLAKHRLVKETQKWHRRLQFLPPSRGFPVQSGGKINFERHKEIVNPQQIEIRHLSNFFQPVDGKLRPAATPRSKSYESVEMPELGKRGKDRKWIDEMLKF